MRNTLTSLGVGDTFSSLALTPSVASGFPEPDLTFLVASVSLSLCSWDPMVEEAAMEATVDMSVRSCQEKVAGMVEKLANQPSDAMVPCLDNFPHSFADIVMFRSEGEQLVKHELIKALSTFKLSMAHPLSSSSRHESPLNNNATVVHPKGNQSYLRQKKFKFKSRKPSFKVIWDMLTKK
jgi:hypothetical protein